MWRLRNRNRVVKELLFNTLSDLVLYIQRQPLESGEWKIKFIPVETIAAPKAKAVPPDEIEPKAGMGEFPIPLSRLKE